MDRECSARAERWLQRHTRWTKSQREAMAQLAPQLLEHLPGQRPWLLTLGGAPGTGKSTLAHLLSHLAFKADSPEHGPFVLSLDDYYLTRADRNHLAATQHPLFARRGVPGTHDLDRLFDDLDALRSRLPASVATPRFDKGADERLPNPRVLKTGTDPVGVILEGWFVGLVPEAEASLASPRSRFEAEEDPDGAWRRRVNQTLGDFQARLELRNPKQWLLKAPDWKAVKAWRWQQEKELPPEVRLLSDPSAVANFLRPFERLVRHQLDTGHLAAGLVIQLDREHRPRLQSPA